MPLTAAEQTRASTIGLWRCARPHRKLLPEPAGTCRDVTASVQGARLMANGWHGPSGPETEPVWRRPPSEFAHTLSALSMNLPSVVGRGCGRATPHWARGHARPTRFKVTAHRRGAKAALHAPEPGRARLLPSRRPIWRNSARQEARPTGFMVTRQVRPARRARHGAARPERKPSLTLGCKGFSLRPSQTRDESRVETRLLLFCLMTTFHLDAARSTPNPEALWT